MAIGNPAQTEYMMQSYNIHTYWEILKYLYTY